MSLDDLELFFNFFFKIYDSAPKSSFLMKKHIHGFQSTCSLS